MDPAARQHVEGAARALGQRQHPFRRESDKFVQIVSISACVGNILQCCHEAAVEREQV